MARIRTVKPEFFKHYDLFQAEVESKLPLRLAFQGLWVVSDREGRFKWQPQALKLDIIPYDNIDMTTILEVLIQHGFITCYEVGGKKYGCIPSWHYHQRPNRDEPPSEIPAPNGDITLYDRPPNQTIRLRIYDRDNYTCVYCQDDLKNKSRSICLDHIIPYCKNGSNRENNLVTCCKKCNSYKGDRTPEECGFTWPEGLGEVYSGSNYTPVNPPLTGGKHPPDKEREGERERERKGKGRGKEGGSPENNEAFIFDGKKTIPFSLGGIYAKTWDEYRTILNGQAKNLSEIIFITWKEFVDFIIENEYTDIFQAKFVSPIDFGILMHKHNFLKNKWKDVIERMLSSGVTPSQNLFFRIPQFINYAESNNTRTNTNRGNTKKIGTGFVSD